MIRHISQLGCRLLYGRQAWFAICSSSSAIRSVRSNAKRAIRTRNTHQKGSKLHRFIRYRKKKAKLNIGVIASTFTVLTGQWNKRIIWYKNHCRSRGENHPNKDVIVVTWSNIQHPFQIFWRDMVSKNTRHLPVRCQTVWQVYTQNTIRQNVDIALCSC